MTDITDQATCPHADSASNHTAREKTHDNRRCWRWSWFGLFDRSFLFSHALLVYFVRLYYLVHPHPFLVQPHLPTWLSRESARSHFSATERRRAGRATAVRPRGLDEETLATHVTSTATAPPGYVPVKEYNVAWISSLLISSEYDLF